MAVLCYDWWTSRVEHRDTRVYSRLTFNQTYANHKIMERKRGDGNVVFTSMLVNIFLRNRNLQLLWPLSHIVTRKVVS